eukprot:s3001_g9.t1
MDNDLPIMSLRAWPSCSTCTTLGDILCFDALWPEDQERDLLWDPDETAIFFDPCYGGDLRVLQPHNTAPTMLHSWAHLLRACSCGCRDRPFSLLRLQQGGARGFGIMSTLLDQVRHLHPEEAALLCTVPLHYVFPGAPRSALCLLGQIAAPLQVLWLQSQFLAHLQDHYWLHSGINALEMIQLYKNGLLQQRAQRWILARMSLPRTLQVQLDELHHDIQVRSPVTPS